MRKRAYALFFFFMVGSVLRAALEPLTIPRAPIKHYRTEGLFEGGLEAKANLEGLRLAAHKAEGFERWVIDFSDGRERIPGKVLPKFQMSYYKADKKVGIDGVEMVIKPAKFLFIFRSIQKNFIDRETIQKLAKQSHHVKEIILYPPIEEGDMAMEFILREDVSFEPHQPKEREGRLVLDLRNS